ATSLLRALNHKGRQNILEVIHERSPITVKEIYSILRMEQSVTSLHLAVLRKSKLVLTQREGQSIFYSINYDTIALVKKGTKFFIP
ncbi:MAG: ArsR/SmtB family transcription factor, partial [Flavisolibacter sp.]